MIFNLVRTVGNRKSAILQNRITIHYDYYLLPDKVSATWRKLIKGTTCITIRFSKTRHTHASLMLKQDMHPKIVQEKLSHAILTMALGTYSRVAPELQEATAIGFDKWCFLT